MSVTLLPGDCRAVLATLPAASVQCCVTSPPYFGLRQYLPEGHPDMALQLGLEASPDAYVAEMVAVFREIRRVLADSGCVFLNLGDSYAGSWGARGRGEDTNAARPDLEAKYGTDAPARRGYASLGIKPKDLLGIPWAVAFALRADGWWLRSDIIWAKPNPMPESAQDRPTSAHEHVFLLSKRASYYYDAEAVAEPAEMTPQRRLTAQPKKAGGHAVDSWKEPRLLREQASADGDGTRNLRNVWSIATQPFSGWTHVTELIPVQASAEPGRGASDSALDDDTARITSPGCPTHAGQPDRVPTGFYDGLSDAQLKSMRGNGAHLAQGIACGSATTPHIPAHSTALPSTSDCSRPEGAGIATRSSTETRKTAPDLPSSAHAISSEETASDRRRTAPSQSGRSSTCRDTGLSRTEVDSSGECGLGTAGDSVRMSGSCRCGYYRKVVSRTSHFATMPPDLAERCIKAGTRPGDTVLDPFAGAGTTLLVADRLGRNGVGVELNPDYAELARRRIYDDCPMFSGLAEAAD